MNQPSRENSPGRVRTVALVSAGISHELNNLLLPMQGHLAALQSLPLGPDAVPHLEALAEVSALLRGLAGSIRVFGDEPLRRSGRVGTDLGVWWGHQGPLLAEVVPSDITIDCSIDADVPPVALERNLVSQVVLNLLMNSVRATRSGGRIEIRARTAEAGGWVELSVIDDGCGMTAKQCAEARIPFFTTKHRGSGGLGLSMVEHIARSVDGQLRIQSVEGEGTSVSLTLPAALLGAAQEDPAEDWAWVHVGDPRLASCLRALLSADGYRLLGPSQLESREISLFVSDADADGLAALADLRARGNRPRALILGEQAAVAEELGASVVHPTAGLEAIRAALAQLAGARRNSS